MLGKFGSRSHFYEYKRNHRNCYGTENWAMKHPNPTRKLIGTAM
jgi:hypothetical protein